jgi:hypothetical protein
MGAALVWGLLLAPPVQAPQGGPVAPMALAAPETVAPEDASAADSPGPDLLDAASIRGVTFDEEDRAPGAGLRVGLTCATCRVTQRWATSRAGGRFDFTGLEPGEYTLVVHAPGGSVMKEVALKSGDDRIVAVPHPPLPRYVKDAKGRIVYRKWAKDPRERTAQVLMGVGGVLLVAGAGMAVGAIVEASVPGCDYSLDYGCDAAPRPGVIRGFAFGSLLSAIGGGALMGTGAVIRRRHRAQLAPSLTRHGAGVSWSLRF